MTSNNKNETLKPCPFCGGEARIREGFCNNEFYIECCSCKFEYGHYQYDDFGYTRDYGKYKTKEEAIKAWNASKAWNTRPKDTIQISRTRLEGLKKQAIPAIGRLTIGFDNGRRVGRIEGNDALIDKLLEENDE